MLQNLVGLQIRLFLQGLIGFEDFREWVAVHVVEQDLSRESAALDKVDVLLMELLDEVISEGEFREQLEMLSETASSTTVDLGSDTAIEMNNLPGGELLSSFTGSTQEVELAPGLLGSDSAPQSAGDS